MSTKRFSDKMENMLNAQMTREAWQAQVYLSYGSWAEVQGYDGIAQFFYKHSNEERQHMFKFLEYVNDRNGTGKVTAIDAPPADPKDMDECLQRTLQHEIDNSAYIYEIVNLAHEEKDWATFNFGQYFVAEQIEEESLINEWIDRYSLASKQKKDNSNLYDLDKDMSTASQEGTPPREAKL